MKLVQDWRRAWRWLSVQIAVLAGSLEVAMMAFPTVKDWLSDEASHVIGLVFVSAIVLGRLVDQKKPDAPVSS